MGRAKEIKIKVIPSKIANDFVKKHHYSGKVVQNSTLHFGCFLDGKLGGVMSYGSPFMKEKVLNLVKTENETLNKKWNEMLELNRMAFSSLLPKNSESRCISVSFKLIKKKAPQIKWILSFSDGTQCGDGTIYRASGFNLTGINKNNSILKLKDGSIVASMTYTKGKNILKQGGRAGIPEGAQKLKGFQLRYIYLIDKKSKLNCENIPFNEIDKIGAGMYKGQKISLAERKALSGVVDSNANFNLES